MMNAADFKAKLASVFSERDVVDLTQSLIAIPSYCGLINQETQAACFISKWFAENGFESEVIEVTAGRSNVVARLPGTGGGQSLLLTGHLDTVPAYDMVNAFTPHIKDGKLFGRGAVDMKGPIAAMICAMKAIKDMGIPLSGDVTFAGVIDEEERSFGTIHLLQNMPKADAAVVGEPTDFGICVAHRGLEWIEIHIEGKTVHGGSQSKGLNAIAMAAKFIMYLEEQMPRFINKSSHGLIGRGSYNLGTIQGGTQPSTVAGDCRITIDRRWLPGETHAGIMAQFQGLIDGFLKQAPGYKCHMRILDSSVMEPGYAHEAMETSLHEPIVKTAGSAVKEMLGSGVNHTYFPAWSDGGLLQHYGGIPTIVFAPGKLESAHSATEHIEVDALVKAVSVYAWMIYQFCRMGH